MSERLYTIAPVGRNRITTPMSPNVTTSHAIPPRPSGEPIRLPNWTATRIISNVVLAILGLFFLLPMLWLITASLDSSASWQLTMPDFSTVKFATALQFEYVRSLWNSFILSSIATVISTVAAFFAAYSFSRHHIPWKGPILLVILFLSGVPITILIVPIYKMFAYIGWLSILPTSLILAVTSLPFQIYLVKNAVDALPLDLEEAAAIEKASTFAIIRRIVLPLTMPGIASAAIFGFVSAWGNFILPQVLIRSSAQQPGPVRMFGFMNSASMDYGAIAAFSILYSLPIVILYLLMSGSFRNGFVLAGAVR